MNTHNPSKAKHKGDPVPDIIVQWLQPFRSVFTAPTWHFALVLVFGALLTPGKRTVSATLRVTGRAMDPNFSSFHRVLNRARWNPRRVARILAQLLVKKLLPNNAPIIIGVDDTVERRWGACISARGIYRDPVRSSRGHFVKTSGLRWLSFMLLTPLPWIKGIKALPILTHLAPSKGWAEKKGYQHKTLPERARLIMHVIQRWFPNRAIIFIGDSSFATHELAYAVGQFATLISRLRLDATLFAPPPPRTPGQRGRPRLKGKPLRKLTELLNDPTVMWTEITLKNWYSNSSKVLEIISGKAIWHRSGTPPKTIRWVLVRDPEGKRDPQAFFSTDTELSPSEIISLYVRRWQIEVTFQEARAHLGVETQRQWSDKAIERTTPILFGLYSLICLWAIDILETIPQSYAAAWYTKPNSTFSDALAAVRTRLWLNSLFQHSPSNRELKKIPADKTQNMAKFDPIDENSLQKLPLSRVKRMIEALCFTM